MKNIIVRLLLFSFLMFSVSDLKAQDGTVELRFTATEVNGKVFLEWTMDLGQTCNGIDITRSTDGVAFSPIGNIQGICGSPFDTVSYSFIDESPIPNQINYYRLTLGNLGPSQSLAVEIISLEGKGYQVRPNPMVSVGKIYFSNDRSEKHRLTIISGNGSVLRQLTTRNDYFDLSVSNMPDGVFIFKIESDDGLTKVASKLVVSK